VWTALYPHIDTGPARPGGIALHGCPLPLRHGLFELNFLFIQKAAGLDLALQYDSLRYDDMTAQRIASRVVGALGWLAGDDTAVMAPQQRVFGGFRLG
jgi:hypothetical protein